MQGNLQFGWNYKIQSSIGQFKKITPNPIKRNEEMKFKIKIKVCKFYYLIEDCLDDNLVIAINTVNNYSITNILDGRIQLKIQSKIQHYFHVVKLDRYRIEQLVYSSENHQDYKGIDILTQKQVTIKRLGSHIQSIEDVMKINEINLLLNLKHPNIINIQEVQKGHDNAYYVILEYCSINLFSYYSLLKKKNRILSQEKIRAIIFQIARALSFLDKNGIIHGDINSHNGIYFSIIKQIFLNDGVVKLAGFGSSVNESDKDQSRIHRALGTYPSPEKLFGNKFRLSCKTDVFSLGCLYIELINGKNIFKEEIPSKIIQKYLIVIGKPQQQIQIEQLKALMEQENCLLPETDGIGLQNFLYGTDQQTIQLITEMLIFVPQYRLKAQEILKSPLFSDFIISQKQQNAQNAKQSMEYNQKFYQVDQITKFDRSKSNGRSAKKSKSKSKIAKKKIKTLNTHKDIDEISTTLPITYNNIYNPDTINQRQYDAYIDSSRRNSQDSLSNINKSFDRKIKGHQNGDIISTINFRKGRSNSTAQDSNGTSKKYINDKSLDRSQINNNENQLNYYQIEEVKYGSVQNSNRSSSHSKDNIFKRTNNSFTNFEMQNEINQSSIALQKSILNSRLSNSKFLLPQVQQEMGFLPSIQNNSPRNLIVPIINQQDSNNVYKSQIAANQSIISHKQVKQIELNNQKQNQLQNGDIRVVMEKGTLSNNNTYIEKKRIYFKSPYLDSERQYLNKIEENRIQLQKNNIKPNKK